MENDKERQDKKEELLTDAERLCKEKFEATCLRMEQEGYTKQILCFSELEKINYVSLLTMPINMLLVYLFIAEHSDLNPMVASCSFIFIHIAIILMNVCKGVSSFPFNVFFVGILYTSFLLIFNGKGPNGDSLNFILSIALNVVLPVLFLVTLNNIVHKAVFSYIAGKDDEAVKVGLNWKKIDTYCICTSLLDKTSYMITTIVPVALVFMVVAFALCYGSDAALVFSLILVFIAGGDLLLLIRLLFHIRPGAEVLYLTHPTEFGIVAFVKNIYQK